MQPIIYELTYRNYCYNRNTFPQTAAERWGRLYGTAEAEAMEHRFQASLIN
jgi:hypothetical protein